MTAEIFPREIRNRITATPAELTRLIAPDWFGRVIGAVMVDGVCFYQVADCKGRIWLAELRAVPTPGFIRAGDAGPSRTPTATIYVPVYGPVCQASAPDPWRAAAEVVR